VYVLETPKTPAIAPASITKTHLQSSQSNSIHNNPIHSYHYIITQSTTSANMSHLQYYAYPGVGVNNQKKFRYSQAVRVGDRIECAGQGM
jgi:hypothetical protein